MNLRDLTDNQLSALSFVVNFADFDLDTKKLKYVYFERGYGLTNYERVESSLLLSVRTAGSTFELSANFEFQSLCDLDTTNPKKYDKVNGICVNINKCVLQDLGATYCMDEDMPLSCQSGSLYTKTLNENDEEVIRCQPLCNKGEFITPGTERDRAICNTECVNEAKDDNGKVVASSSYSVSKIDNIEPQVTIDIEDKIGLGSNNTLPTSYNVDTNLSGGTVECKDNNTTVTNTSELELGNHTITCTVTTGSGKKATVSKTISVVNEYEITFDDLDDTTDNVVRIVLQGDKLGELPTVEKSGFIGWYKEREYLEEININTIPSSSTTYYAKYEEIPNEGE
jgi:hypothetical protein